MKALSIINSIVLLIVFQTSEAQTYKFKEPLAHTYSVVARDSVTGKMAVGVQSHWFSVGTLVSWGKSGIGVVATQSFVNPSFGPEGLRLMSEGKNASEALKTLIEADEGRDFRQLAILDVNGVVEAYTGKSCIESAGHYVGNNFSVQANMMLNDKVVPAMKEAYKSNPNLPIAERILKTMQAAQNAGGDIRGKQSAAIIVVNGKPVDEVWMDKKVDLRVDDHKEPLKELERLLKVHRAYEHMNNGDLAIEHGNMDKALKEYGAAEALFPDNLEMRYWKAISMANKGMLDEAKPILKAIFEEDENWRELTRRLPASNLLEVSEEDLKRILEM